jgi:hypothetical protein
VTKPNLTEPIILSYYRFMFLASFSLSLLL